MTLVENTKPEKPEWSFKDENGYWKGRPRDEEKKYKEEPLQFLLLDERNHGFATDNLCDTHVLTLHKHSRNPKIGTRRDIDVYDKVRYKKDEKDERCRFTFRVGSADIFKSITVAKFNEYLDAFKGFPVALLCFHNVEFLFPSTEDIDHFEIVGYNTPSRMLTAEYKHKYNGQVYIFRSGMFGSEEEWLEQLPKTYQ